MLKSRVPPFFFPLVAVFNEILLWLASSSPGERTTEGLPTSLADGNKWLCSNQSIWFTLYTGEAGGSETSDGVVWRRCHALHSLCCPVSTILLPSFHTELHTNSFLGVFTGLGDNKTIVKKKKKKKKPPTPILGYISAVQLACSQPRRGRKGSKQGTQPSTSCAVPQFMGTTSQHAMLQLAWSQMLL